MNTSILFGSPCPAAVTAARWLLLSSWSCSACKGLELVGNVFIKGCLQICYINHIYTFYSYLGSGVNHTIYCWVKSDWTGFLVFCVIINVNGINFFWNRTWKFLEDLSKRTDMMAKTMKIRPKL